MATVESTNSPQEDPLIQGLIGAKNHEVEVIAFGIAYHGRLQDINLEYGYVTVKDGADQATLELERIESFRIID